MDPNTANFLGRIEGKLDQLVGTVTEQGKDIARHGERITRAEGDIKDLQTERTENRRQNLSLRVQITLALTGPLLAAAIGTVFTALNSR